MAYMTVVPEYRCGGRGCSLKATVEAFTAGGHTMGYYCVPHGRGVINKRGKFEIQVADAQEKLERERES